MTRVNIFYGSKKKFNEIIPEKYRTLTDVAYESDKNSKQFYIVVEGENKKKTNEERTTIKNFVAGSDEYAGVSEHVIINFNNFIAKFEVENMYLHNPPIQISNQVERLNEDVKINYQEYTQLEVAHLQTINNEYNNVIIGQEDAKNELIQALFPLTIEAREKPVVILFYGKSGVGKTETAKYISSILQEPLFRKQFSMYQNNQFATYLFGGAHYEKSFAKDMLDRESNVLLLDEFDKAHVSFHSAFYQLFDEGTYEDQNYNLDLQKSIIICTSNYSSLSEIEKHLGSAIYNRFDKVIHFSDLSVESKAKIGEKEYIEISGNYNHFLNDDIKVRLEESYKYCDNVRQIRHLIEDTIALDIVSKAFI
ncbi:ATP-dependent Clp protease ATP-binding subunit [Listeria booriae]|uniref:AAA family ATPase n=1 Tax=Listeria booriae TaxID=1552123 RepID=UPI0016296561|nr:AAA family ATPase [Listeria booriae]MBC1889114.1 ATP-dependent Clp protease ATP-binding subunit [Listeria booriae]